MDATYFREPGALRRKAPRTWVLELKRIPREYFTPKKPRDHTQVRKYDSASKKMLFGRFLGRPLDALKSPFL